MKKFLFAGVALIALGGAASAADLAVKARPLPAAPVFTWTGFYIGGHVGAAGEPKNGMPCQCNSARPRRASFRSPAVT